MGPIETTLVLAIVAGLGYVGWQVFALFRGAEKRVRAIDRGERMADDRTRAALERPGALPSQPITVESAAAIEPRAESEPCPICGGHLHVADHVAAHEGPRRQRRVELRCGDCGRIDTLWFELSARETN